MANERKPLTLLASASLIALAAASIPSAGSQPLPPGFTETRLIPAHPAHGASRTIAWAPDGSVMFLAQSSGLDDKIWTYDGSSWGDDVPAIDLAGTVAHTGERGINGLAVDPDYVQNKKLWVYYTYFHDPVHNRLSTFEYDQATDTLQNEEVILQIFVENTNHNGGCLAFAPDKTLFLGVGDDQEWSRTAQNPHDLRGTIIHINRDGSGAWDNPYLDGVNGDPRVWAIGVRNPFRCNVQDTGGGSYNLWFGDVGSGAYEEINIGVAGANYGWPLVEGPQPPGVAGMTYPFYWYAHTPPDGAAVVGGDHVEAGEFYAPYEGNYFFGDWEHGEIYRMELSPTNEILSVEVWFAEGSGTVTDFEFGPDGRLYVSSIGVFRENVWVYEYVGGDNSQPIARATGTPDSGAASLMVSFDGSTSSDPDGDTLRFDGDLGDGTIITDGGPSVSHSYEQGEYYAVLTVDDSPTQGENSLTDTAAPVRIVAGNDRPAVTITAPTSDLMYDAGDVIAYSGTGSDTEEGSLPCSQFQWRADFHHGEHTHPAFGPVQGSCSGTFTIPTVGETAPDTWYRFYATVSDTGVPIGANGVLSGSEYVDIFPNKSWMTFESTPLTDLKLSLDTTPFTPPMTVQGVVGLLREIGAPVMQLGSDGKYYWWASWSDGGEREHMISTPPVDTTYTATFECAIGEVQQLEITRSGSQLDLRWTAPESDDCVQTPLDRYSVYVGASAVPVALPGSFPQDPAFSLAGTTNATTFAYTPPDGAPDLEVFLVVAVGANDLEGVVGHYGF